MGVISWLAERIGVDPKDNPIIGAADGAVGMAGAGALANTAVKSMEKTAGQFVSQGGNVPPLQNASLAADFGNGVFPLVSSGLFVPGQGLPAAGIQRGQSTGRA